jgi:hypothetical protein
LFRSDPGFLSPIPVSGLDPAKSGRISRARVLILGEIAGRFTAVQQLGLSKSTPKFESRWKAFLWPDVTCAPGAKTALDIGRLVAFLVAGGTAFMAVFGFMPLLGLIDSVIYAGLGYGIGRGSRVCAALALLFYVLGQVTVYAAGLGGFNIVLPIIIIFVFINALRGAIMLRRLKAQKKQPEPTAAAPTQGS